MSKVNFGENWAILRGAKANKTQSVDFAGAPGAPKINASNVSSTTAGAYKGQGSKGGGEARNKQEEERKAKGIKSDSGGGNLTGRKCVIRTGPNKGGVDPDCVSYNPTLVGRPRLPVPTSTKDPVFKQDMYKLMHGDGGYEDPNLNGGDNKPVGKSRAAAIVYAIMGKREAGTGGDTPLSSRQRRVEKHLPALGKMGHKNRQKALQAIHESHDKDTSAGRDIRNAVHKALIANPSASPEELLQTLKSHESGDLTKNLHADEIRYIMADKKFQSDVRNAGWKIKTLLRNNKNATPEDILAALEGNTGSLTDDEIMALIKSGGFVRGVHNAPKPGQPQAQGGPSEPAGRTDKWLNDNNADNGFNLVNSIMAELDSINSKGAQSDENSGKYDPNTYGQGDYDSVVANIMKKFPKLDEGMLRKTLREEYGLSAPSPATAPTLQTSKPVRPEKGHPSRYDNVPDRFKGFGSDKNRRTQAHVAADNVHAPQQEYYKAQREADAAAAAGGPETPGGATPAEDQAQPDSGGGTPGPETPPAGTPGGEQAPPPPAEAQPAPAQPPAQKPAPAQPPAPAAQQPAQPAQPPAKPPAPAAKPPAQAKPPSAGRQRAEQTINSIRSHPIYKAISAIPGASKFLDSKLNEFLSHHDEPEAETETEKEPGKAEESKGTKSENPSRTPRRTRAEIIAAKAAANKAKNEAAANKANEEKKGTVKASEHSPTPPHGWQFCESSSSTPPIAQGQDANRNLVKVPEGWSPTVS